MNLNQLVDKLEFAIARNSTPAILALTKQIHSDGTAFYNIYNNDIGLNETPEDFQAMFRRFKAAEAAGAAAIASKETKQVTAGVDEANQSTAGVADVRASEPGSSHTTPEGRQLSVIAEMLREQRDSIASLQQNQESIQQNQEALTSAVASLQQNQEALQRNQEALQRNNRILHDELSAIRSQVERLPEQQDAFAMDMLEQQRLLRSDLEKVQVDLDQVKRQRETTPPVTVVTDLLGFGPPLLDSSVIKPPCQKIIDLFARASQ